MVTCTMVLLYEGQYTYTTPLFLNMAAIYGTVLSTMFELVVM
jgi:hypothetical protein